MQSLYRNLDLHELASKLNRYTLNIQDYQMLTPTLAKVCITTTGDAPVKEEIRASISGMFKGLASPVVASFRKVTADGGITTLVGFVKAAHEVREMESIDKTKFKAMASNLLMDETDKSLWEIRNGGAGQYLVKQGEEDLSELAQLAYSKKTNLPVLAEIASVPAIPKEFAAYVDLKSEEVLHGYVVEASGDKLHIVPQGEATSIEISANQLVEVVNLDGEDTKAMGLEMAANMDRQAMVEYYKKAYVYAPDYVRQIIEMIDEHAYA